MSHIQPVILSGGSGTRLWPVSRSLYPKQLLPLISDKSMLQETANRVSSPGGFEPPIIICNDEHRFTIASQLQELGIKPKAQVLEPVGRNTAPAAAVAALLAEQDDPETILLILPADHHIEDPEAFLSTIEAGQEAAAEGHLVTFGIRPTAPETGYGYIKQGEPLASGKGFKVANFKEKPDLSTAWSYLDEGGYHWNAGIFMFRADQLLKEMEAYCPAIVESCRQAVTKSIRDLDFLRLDPDAFGQSPSDSIDYAVMEHTDHAVVIPASMGWNDIGSWSALWDIGAKDGANNVCLGDVLVEDSSDNYIRGEERLIATLGVKDLVIVETADVVMVADRNRAEEIKSLVEQLRSKGRGEPESHVRVYRPWGFYESIQSGPRHQVKHLSVNPGSKLSLQLHHKRAEHWVVVQGQAKVTIGKEDRLLKENESVYIPVETLHRLENPGPGPLSIIEVQSGSYLGEDDIERFEDDYQRHKNPSEAAE